MADGAPRLSQKMAEYCGFPMARLRASVPPDGYPRSLGSGQARGEVERGDGKPGVVSSAGGRGGPPGPSPMGVTEGGWHSAPFRR